jgi:hypothetical protein
VHIQEEVLGTPSERALVLDDKTIKTYFWLELPYRHEWKKNRCSTLSELEAQRAEDYSRRLLRAGNNSDSDLSTWERNDYAEIQKKKREESRCDIEIEQKSRIEAYSHFFGENATDYTGHNFSKWSDSVKYLGRRFYELQAEERFEEEKLFGSFTLSRAATASAPSISLSDSRAKPRVVSEIIVVSAPNPSPEYSQRLVQSLESAWGKRSEGNGTTEWQWHKEDFSAKLRYDVAAPPFLGLTIKSK